MSTSNETNDQATDQDALGMSDDAFADMDPSVFEQEPVTDPEEDSTDEPTDDELESEDNVEYEDDGTEADDSDEDSETDEDDSDDESEDSDGDDEESSEGDDDPEEKSEDESDDKETDFKSEYEKLMAPFRANGKEMKVDSIDDARQLMQMGANYNKKMAALKPSLKSMKLLEKHELLSEEKLGYLIDLHKGDKGAIQKLVKDSGIDPLDMDVESDNGYKPESYTVDDREMELDDVLERIQDTSSYSDTINLVSNKWDAASKQHVANNPTALETINSHMASGVYERVNAEVDKQRTFGRLDGLSDIEAYHQVGHAMSEKGALNDLFETEAPPEKKVVKPRKPKEDPKLKEKKRAASSTRTKPAKKALDYNPLGMSDEDYAREINENLL